MCGRYCIGPDNEALRKIVAEAQEKAEGRGFTVKTGEIFPSEIAPAVANGRDLKPAVFPMRWGFPGKSGKPVINARSETAEEKPLFRESARFRRCLLPATDYYEWRHAPGEKEKYAIRPEGKKLLYLGGLYRLRPGEPCAEFVILTRPASESVAFLHDRMPVILPEERIHDWLNPELPLSDLLAASEKRMQFRTA